MKRLHLILTLAVPCFLCAGSTPPLVVPAPVPGPLAALPATVSSTATALPQPATTAPAIIAPAKEGWSEVREVITSAGVVMSMQTGRSFSDSPGATKPDRKAEMIDAWIYSSEPDWGATSLPKQIGCDLDVDAWDKLAAADVAQLLDAAEASHTARDSITVEPAQIKVHAFRTSNNVVGLVRIVNERCPNGEGRQARVESKIVVKP